MSPIARRISAACLFGLLGSCVANVPVPRPEDARGDETVLRQLQEGRRLYLGKCSSCHGLSDVDRFSDREWNEHVGEMLALRKVRLNEEEYAALARYLTTMNGRE